ncbi:uncharacterized protein LOC136749631 [Amia ocellicauda]|uniref:uncharacterized protein LOC136749631 n=1 Tax=Amia ocellicauda TaxID=2972642 RepID=UPI003464937D
MYSYTSVLVLIASLQTLNSQDTCSNPTDQLTNQGNCQGRTYNKLTEICCSNGKVLSGNVNLLCCGEEAFDPSKSSCCMRKVFPGAGLSCCEHMAYSTSNESCCQGTLTSNISEVVSQCCGAKAYYPVNQLCCNGKIYPREINSTCCASGLYNSATELCCGRIIKKKELSDLCCGNKTFNPKTHTCCVDLTIQSISKVDACCTNFMKLIPYNSTYKSCDTGKLISKKQEKPPQSSQECGNSCFNKSEQICCDKRINPCVAGNLTKCCGDRAYNPSQLECHGKELFLGKSKMRVEPCGWDMYYDPNAELCWVNKISHLGLVYRPNQTCCDGNITNTPGTGWNGGKCCKSVGYNPSTHICCSGKLFKRKIETPLQCCDQNVFGATEKSFLCCNGTLHKNIKEGSICRGSEVYFPGNQSVCGDLKYQQPGLHCCGHQAFDPTKEICCDGHRHGKVPNRSCCGVDTFDLKSQHLKCCNGQLHNLDSISRNHQCCGKNLIQDTNQDVCCSSRQHQLVHKKQSKFSCCGHHYYNTSLYSCCAEKLHKNIRLGDSEDHSSGSQCRLIQLADLKTYHLCHKTVWVWEVSSMASGNVSFNYLVKNVIMIKADNKAEPQLEPHLQQLDHCHCPLLALGRTYALWEDHGNIFIVDLSHLGPSCVYHVLQAKETMLCQKKNTL